MQGGKPPGKKEKTHPQTLRPTPEVGFSRIFGGLSCNNPRLRGFFGKQFVDEDPVLRIFHRLRSSKSHESRQVPEIKAGSFNQGRFLESHEGSYCDQRHASQLGTFQDLGRVRATSFWGDKQSYVGSMDPCHCKSLAVLLR